MKLLFVLAAAGAAYAYIAQNGASPAVYAGLIGAAVIAALVVGLRREGEF